MRMIRNYKNCIPPFKLTNEFNLSGVSNWKTNKGTGTNEIATEQEIRTKLEATSVVVTPLKYCTAAKARAMGGIIPIMIDTKLVRYSDVSKPIDPDPKVGVDIIYRGGTPSYIQLGFSKITGTTGVIDGLKNNGSIYKVWVGSGFTVRFTEGAMIATTINGTGSVASKDGDRVYVYVLNGNTSNGGNGNVQSIARFMIPTGSFTLGTNTTYTIS